MLPGEGYYTPHGTVTEEFTVEWQLAWENHSLCTEIGTQDLTHTKDWSAIYSEIICETKC